VSFGKPRRIEWKDSHWTTKLGHVFKLTNSIECQFVKVSECHSEVMTKNVKGKLKKRRDELEALSDSKGGEFRIDWCKRAKAGIGRKKNEEYPLLPKHSHHMHKGKVWIVAIYVLTDVQGMGFIKIRNGQKTIWHFAVECGET